MVRFTVPYADIVTISPDFLPHSMELFEIDELHEGRLLITSGVTGAGDTGTRDDA